MMTPYWIVAMILAVLGALLFLPLSLTITLNEQGKPALRGRVAGIVVYREPTPERPVRLTDYTPRALRKRQKAALRQQKKAEKKAARKAKKATATATTPTKGSLIEQIGSIREIVSLVLRRSLGHAHIDVVRLAVTVASNDAAKTALLYGATCTAMAALTEVFDNCSHLRVRDRAAYGVAADFTCDKCRADVMIHIRLRLWQIVDIAARAVFRAIAKH